MLTHQLLEQERNDVGFAFWTSKENGDKKSSWGMFNPPVAGSAASSSGCLRAARENLVARVYPRASADPSPAYHYDSATGAFSLSATGNARDPATVVSIPPEVTGAVSSTGAVKASVTTERDGTRLVNASPSGGSFSIAVAPASLALTGCPE